MRPGGLLVVVGATVAVAAAAAVACTVIVVVLVGTVVVVVVDGGRRRRRVTTVDVDGGRGRWSDGGQIEVVLASRRGRGCGVVCGRSRVVSELVPGHRRARGRRVRRGTAAPLTCARSTVARRPWRRRRSCVVDAPVVVPVVVLDGGESSPSRTRTGGRGPRFSPASAGSPGWTARPSAFPASDAAASQPAPTRNTEAASAAKQAVRLLTVAVAGGEASNPTAAAVAAVADGRPDAAAVVVVAGASCRAGALQAQTRGVGAREAIACRPARRGVCGSARAGGRDVRRRLARELRRAGA